MLLTALIVYKDDPHGSPIFSQVRCGRNNKPFKIYKFRSMYCDAEERLKDLLKDNEMDGPAFKIKDDPRITRVGKYIRKTSIDELPQLWNAFDEYIKKLSECYGIPCLRVEIYYHYSIYNNF